MRSVGIFEQRNQKLQRILVGGGFAARRDRKEVIYEVGRSRWCGVGRGVERVALNFCAQSTGTRRGEEHHAGGKAVSPGPRLARASFRSFRALWPSVARCEFQCE